ncbi:Fic family protein [Spirochaetia bacterium]|nr:Fic family protein [Spirochaetia bacterium]
MPDEYEYEYLDPDYTYTDPETGVLRNLGNITDRNALEFAESAAHAKRSMELEINPIKITDSFSLFSIHKHLFQDVYKWAGQKRTVEISKAGKQFFPLDHFDTALVYIDNLISDYHKLQKKDITKIAHRLADILDTVNELHPFREGNGRTQRELIRSLALEKGYTLNLNPPNNSEVYERYMSGTIESDVEKLTSLILELLKTK